MPNIKVNDEAHWHALRAKNIGSSESAALLGLSPWSTPWQLYMEKTGRVPRSVSDNPMMAAGRHLEPALAGWAQDKFGIEVRKVRRYIQHDTVPGMGASLDFETSKGERTPVEIKFSLFSDGWDWEGDVITKAPDNYIIQVQHEIACLGADKGYLVAFCGGDLRMMEIDRSPVLVQAIESAVTQFWADVEAGREPPINFEQDAELVRQLQAAAGGKPIDVSDDAHKARLVRNLARLSAMSRRVEERLDATKAEILTIAGDADFVHANGLTVDCKMVADTPGKIVTPEMVGQIIGGRKGYRKCQMKRGKKNV